MAGAIEKLKRYGFETRDPRAHTPHVEAGMWVKAGTQAERFWLKVKSVCGDGSLRCGVDNELLTLPWRLGDELVLGREHVLESANVTDRIEFETLALALGSPREAALAWHSSKVR